jgi:arginine/serine-rich splicing factor 17
MKADERDSILKKEADREEKMRRRMEREDRRRQRKLQRRNVNDEEEMNHRIAVEERKLLVAQRKLESIRMLDELLERVKVITTKAFCHHCLLFCFFAS